MKIMRRKGRRIATIAIGAIAVTGCIAGCVALGKVNKDDKTKTLTAFNFTVGKLDDTTGKVVSGNKSQLFTEKYYDLENLVIKYDKNAEVKVDLNYYDEDKEFLAHEVLDVDYDPSDIPAAATNAEFVRIEIIPLEDADGEVKLFERVGYVSQVTIKVNK